MPLYHNFSYGSARYIRGGQHYTFLSARRNSELNRQKPANFARQWRILIVSLSLPLSSRGRRMRTAATNPARAGSILALVGAMTGNSDKCVRRRRRHGARENAIPVSSVTTRRNFFFAPMSFFIFQAVCRTRSYTFVGSCSSLYTLRNASLNG